MDVSIKFDGVIAHGFSIVYEEPGMIILNSRDGQIIENQLFNNESITLLYFDKFKARQEIEIRPISIAFSVTRRGVNRYTIIYT